MTADIFVKGLDGTPGDPGELAPPASIDYTGKPPANGGSCNKRGHCVCAVSGAAGGSGNPGNPGKPGSAPPHCPTLCVIVGRLASDLVIQTQGGKGGLGGAGSNASNGGQGQDGGHNDPKCLKGGWFSSAPCHPTKGGIGGNAARGGDGGPGGAGGDGGDIYVYYFEAQNIGPNGTVYQIYPRSSPGAVGSGGLPGLASNPGLGGLNEAANGERQASGLTSRNGDPGLLGNPPGNPGHVQAVNLFTL